MNLRTGNVEHDAILERLPKYTCHKVVGAVRIKDLTLIAGEAGSRWCTPVDLGLGLIKLHTAWMERHKPEVGGYLVVYADGYASYSPAEAFESGYVIGDQSPAEESQTLADAIATRARADALVLDGDAMANLEPAANPRPPQLTVEEECP